MSEIINTDRELIIKMLNREYKDDHPSVYLYVCGQERAQKTAIFHIIKYVRVIFYGCFDDYILKTHIIEFLEYKKDQYKKGEIKVKPVY